MKKVLLLLVVLMLSASLFAANNQFWGLKGNFAASGSFINQGAGNVHGDDATFAFNLKPSFGAYFGPNDLWGIRGGVNYTYYQPGAHPSVLNLAMLFIGGDISL